MWFKNIITHILPCDDTGSKIEKILVRIIQVGLYLCLVIPFIIFKQVMFPYVYSKALFFQIIIEALLIFYIPLSLAYPKYRPNLKHPLTRAMLIFFGVFTLAAFLGVDRAQSIWSTQERMTGIFTLVHFVVFYFMVVSVFKDNWQLYVRAIVISGVVMAGFGLYQRYMLGSDRPFATLGNSGYFGTYMMFSIYYILILFIVEKQKWLRFLLIPIFAFITAALLASAARSVIIAMGVSLVAGFFMLSKSTVKVSRVWYGLMVVAGLFGVISFYLAYTGALPSVLYEKLPLLSRIKGISLTDNSRIMTWQAGLGGVLKRPILGYGPENYSVPFNQFYNVKLTDVSSFGGSLNFDKAHNQFLEYLVTLGVLGFAAYIYFIFQSLRVLWAKRQSLISIVLFVSVIAYCVVIAFTFDTPVGYLLLMSLFSIITLETPHTFPKTKKRTWLPSSTTVAVISSVSGIVLLFIVGYLNVKTAFASRYAAIGSSETETPNVPKEAIFSYFYKSLEYQPIYAHEISRYLGMHYLDKIYEYDPALKTNLVYVANVLEPGSKNDWHKLTMLGRVYGILCKGQGELCDTAFDYIAKAKVLAPARFQVYIEEFVIYNQLGDFKRARESYEKAVSLDYPFAWQKRDFYLDIGYMYSMAGDLEQSFFYYNFLIERDPTNLEAIESAALVLKRKGDTEKAKEYALKMLEVDPTLENKVNGFIQSLKDGLADHAQE